MLDLIDRPATSIDEEELAERFRTLGKWRQPGVPHGGWLCTGIEDLGSPSEICEMCETATIRYVHTMLHPDYPEELRLRLRLCRQHGERPRRCAAA